MSDFLKTMAESSAARAYAAKESLKSSDLDLPVVPLSLEGFDLIAEIKNRSPSEGMLAGSPGDHGERASRYVEGGAAAISVLTEPTQFAGDLAHIEDVVEAIAGASVPVMCKDFLVDPVQILEARASGASGILLIANMLSNAQLEDMLGCAYEHAMFVLLESFDEEDLSRCKALLEQPRHLDRARSNGLLLGVNTRDLRTLHVDPDRLKALGPQLPRDVTCVAESGLHDGPDAAAAAGWGYGVALVGTALMRSDDPTGLIRDMLSAGRERMAA
jgi:indole-3-glycerol phosphate synthase